MNDVSQVRSVTAHVLTPANRTEAGKKTAEAKPVVAPEPEQLKVEAEVASIDANKGKQLDEAVGAMQDFVQSVKRELQFSVDQDLGRTVVKVVDSESGDLIRQIPEEIFLELARKVKEHGEINLFNATG